MQVDYFYSFVAGFIVGIAIDGTLGLGLYFSILCILLGVFIYFFAPVMSRKNTVLPVSLLLFGCAIGVFRADFSASETSAHLLDDLVGRDAKVLGIIIDEPDVREEYTNIVLEVKNVLDENVIHIRPEIKSARILVRIPTYPELKYGDEISAYGKITLPKNFSAEDSLRTFDYRSYLAKDGIHHQMYFPDTTLVSHGNGNVIREKLFTMKSWFIKNISQNIPEPEASLASGITLGAKQSLGKDLIQKFRETGVAHIVVLSGYNIAVVAGIISRLIMFMPFSIRLFMSALGITLFAVMVGGGATVVRATAMALVVILARMLGREGDALRVLVLVGGLMVFANPMILFHDVSFQLSFLATLSIVVFVPVLEKYFLCISNRLIREIVVTTFATQIFVLPLILYHMGSVSLIGFISNIFVLPVVPVAMIAVALVAIFSWVPLAGNLFTIIAYSLLSYIVILVEFFARVPFASLSGIVFPFWMLVFAYALLGFYIIKNSSAKTHEKK